MSWYFVNATGNSQGPFSIDMLKSKYGTELKDTSYVWNGTTVQQWTPLNKVSGIGIGGYNCSNYWNSGTISLNKYSIITSIEERYATMVYIFDFENESDSKISQELQFDITIDSDAFISNFIADIDGEIFEGITKEKEEAKQEYIDAQEND
eukprot:552040_1